MERLPLIEREGRHRCSEKGLAVNTGYHPKGEVERHTNERIIFRKPFTLGRSPEVYSAGVYQVETMRVPAEGAWHTAWVRSSTVLVIPTATGSYCHEVRWCDLDEAILRDEDAGRPSEPNENPDRGTSVNGDKLL